MGYRVRYQSEGLGDTIAKITEATGIAPTMRVVDKLTGLKCGCCGRRRRLNKKFPYRKQHR